MKMKFLLLTVFVAAVTAAPSPDGGEPVEMIVNGLPEGEPLEISDVLGIKLKEHVDGTVVATNLLHPFSAAGIAEAAAAAEESKPELVAPEVLPEAVVLPEPVLPELSLPAPVVLPEPALPEVAIPEAVILPEPALPEVAIPEAVILPEPALPEVAIPEAVILPGPALPEVVIPEAVILPAPASPEVVPEVVEAEELPNPAAQLPSGEVFNDGVVQVTVNGPESGLVSTIQSWFNMVLNYFNDGVPVSQQIV